MFFSWGASGLFLEEADEVLRVLETKKFGNLLCTQSRIQQRVFSVVYHFQLYVFLCGLARFLLYKIAEIVG